MRTVGALQQWKTLTGTSLIRVTHQYPRCSKDLRPIASASRKGEDIYWSKPDV
jgi:hypothetical protein